MAQVLVQNNMDLSVGAIATYKASLEDEKEIETLYKQIKQVMQNMDSLLMQYQYMLTNTTLISSNRVQSITNEYKN